MNKDKNTTPSEFTTRRLKMRQWRNEDYEPFAAMSADPEVMRFFPKTLSRQESNAIADTASGLISKNGWGFWAIELIDGGQFIGFTGLHSLGSEYLFYPGVEIGWRLGRPYWGQGFAYEAGCAALQYGFNDLALNEVVSFTSVNNLRSESVMNRLGLKNEGANFFHPKLPKGDPLSEHVLYRITEKQWCTTLL